MIDSWSINLEDLISEIGIDKDTLVELLGIYCCEMTEEMQLVKLSLKSQEWSGLQKSVHNIKGVSGNLYLQNMFMAAEIIDLKLKQNDYIGVENPIHNLLSTFEETLIKIQLISKQQVQTS
jgi:HPt (histidine-containing phosphotransfer) domain-containing protein